MNNIVVNVLRKVKYKFIEPIQVYIKTIGVLNYKLLKGQKNIFYIGVPAHTNLGDLAQGVCIRKWLKKHYPDYNIIEIETNALVNTWLSLLNRLKKVCKADKDFIVFQSGYTTTDLGGYADIVHQEVMKILPDVRILMMPQTIFFKTKRRKELCSEVYNSHKKMLYLARDNVSYGMAKKMFPDISVLCYPDIVTTLIGNYPTNENRDGIIFCLRNDSEKNYTDAELAALIKRCGEFAATTRTDTTKGKSVVTKAEEYINFEIEKYSHFKVMVTDRYHGTILSLVAGTPVVIIKTTDHKVVTGADWFKGIYDDYVYVARDLDDAYKLAKELYHMELTYDLKPFFEKEYYDKLPQLFQTKIGDTL